MPYLRGMDIRITGHTVAGDGNQRSRLGTAQSADLGMAVDARPIAHTFAPATHVTQPRRNILPQTSKVVWRAAVMHDIALLHVERQVVFALLRTDNHHRFTMRDREPKFVPDIGIIRADVGQAGLG